MRKVFPTDRYRQTPGLGLAARTLNGYLSMVHIGLMLLACLVILASPPDALAVAANFQVGFDAYERGDYVTALREFRALAKQGDARAQTTLGWMYFIGEGVPQDYARAFSWYHLVAKQGDASAQYNLGVMYSKGQGVPQDYTQALSW
jgi:TPR repeat protein